MSERFLSMISIPVLAASQEKRSVVIELEKIRTLTVTARVSYNSEATVGATINLYFSPDGINWDTVAYAFFLINLTVGETVQETHNIDAPESGYMSVEISNGDSVYNVAEVFIFTKQRKWGEKICPE